MKVGRCRGSHWPQEDREMRMLLVSCLLHSVEGQRLIIGHARNEQVFISDSHIRFKSQQTRGDYHNGMNCKELQKQLPQRLVTNLLPHSLSVIYNATYNNVGIINAPSLNWG
jgi:hypothetical protein